MVKAMKGDNPDRGVVPLAGSREKLQTGLEDPQGLAKGGEMLAKLVGSRVIFHLRDGQAIAGKITGVSRFEILAITEDSKRKLFLKHSVDWLEL